jgi:hypothetical protein
MHGWPVAVSSVRAAEVWIDREGRCYGAPSPSGGRWLYRLAGAGLDFVGHGARRCAGCGVTVDPDPASGEPFAKCPLCGAGP